MEFNILNPYAVTGLAHVRGLDFIIQCYSKGSSSSSPVIPDVPENLKIERFLDCVANYFANDFGEDVVNKQDYKAEIISVAAEAINNYGLGIGYKGKYTAAQQCFIDEMFAVVNDVPLSSFGEYFQNIQNKIASSNLSKAEQKPLYAAVSVGWNNYVYWIDKIKNGEGSWAEYLDTLEGVKADLPFYVAAAIEGTLIGYNTMPETCVCLPSADVVSAVIGSLAVGAGKVIFKWMPVKNEICNGETIIPEMPTYMDLPINAEIPVVVPQNNNSNTEPLYTNDIISLL